MAMTRKDYVALAISMGLALRWMQDCESKDGAYAMAREVADSLNASNMNFQRGRFLDFVYEVADGKRDAEGKIVKNAA
jgi:hypothetical protein